MVQAGLRHHGLHHYENMCTPTTRPKWYFKVEALCLTLFVHASPTIRKLAFRLASALAKDGNSTSESDGYSNDALEQNVGETYVEDLLSCDACQVPCFAVAYSSAFFHEQCVLAVLCV